MFIINIYARLKIKLFVFFVFVFVDFRIIASDYPFGILKLSSDVYTNFRYQIRALPFYRNAHANVFRFCRKIKHSDTIPDIIILHMFPVYILFPPDFSNSQDKCFNYH
jgi:hypothetical protein